MSLHELISLSFEERDRMTLEEAKLSIAEGSSSIRHILDNGDGTHSIMSHINCEWCDYCTERVEYGVEIHVAKLDPYENEKRWIALAEEEERQEAIAELEEDKRWDSWIASGL